MRVFQTCALKTPGAKRYLVLVMTPDGTIEDRAVAVGVTSRVFAQVLAGLGTGEQVVVGMKSKNTPARDSASAMRNGRSGYGSGPRLGGYP